MKIIIKIGMNYFFYGRAILKTFSQAHNAPINVNPASKGGGGGARGRDLSILKEVLSNSPGYETNINRKCQKKPHPGAKYLNKLYYNTYNTII